MRSLEFPRSKILGKIKSVKNMCNLSNLKKMVLHMLLADFVVYYIDINLFAGGGKGEIINLRGSNCFSISCLFFFEKFRTGKWRGSLKISGL